MGKRRMARTPGHMLPFGKPETTEVTRRIRHTGRNGSVWYTESLPSMNPEPENKPLPVSDKTLDFHHERCAGKRGVVDLWWRDDRGWCASCYEFKYGVAPFFDELLEDPPANWKDVI